MTVTLTHIGRSWWWERNKCTVECSDGRIVDPVEHLRPEGMEYEVVETDRGIEGHYFHCSSGQGKVLSFKKLFLRRSEYSEVVHIGSEPSPPPSDVVSFVKSELEWT